MLINYFYTPKYQKNKHHQRNHTHNIKQKRFMLKKFKIIFLGGNLEEGCLEISDLPKILLVGNMLR